MMSTAIKCLNEINSNPLYIVENYVNSIEQLVQCETIEDLFNNIKSIYLKMCNYVNKNKKSHNTRLKEDVLYYINSNYHDKNMCLNMVADRFELTPVYLSRFFKEQTGENFMDYLNSLRLEKAIALFKDENRRISEVSGMVGYANLNSFTRLFKKYKGVTPSKFIEQTIGLPGYN